MTVLSDKRVRYLLVGGYNTVVGYGAFAGLYVLLGDRVHYLAIAVAANVVSVLNAFVTYRLFVFKVRGNVAQDLLRFSSVYVVGVILALLLLPACVEVIGLAPLKAQALVIVVVASTSYLGHDRFSFRRSTEAGAEVVSS